MIDRIEISNFKSHKLTQLDLSPGVNVIVGPTDSGKSVIIGALKWLVVNRPSGDSFRSSWGGDTKVSVEIDGLLVSRFKGKKNRYLITGEDGHEGVYEAPKTNVPEEVSKILNLNEINLQTQFESHFLLSKSAGEVATHFNKVAHLSKIDLGIQNLQSWIRKIQGELNHNDIELGNQLEAISEYDDLDEIEERVTALEAIEEKRIQVRSDEDKLQSLVLNISHIDTDIKDAKETAQGDELVTSILTTIKEQKVVENEKEKLEELLKTMDDWLERGKELERSLALEKPINELCQVYLDIKKLTSVGNALWNHLLAFDEVEDLEITFNLDLKELEEKFHKNIGEVCPLCGNKIK